MYKVPSSSERLESGLHFRNFNVKGAGSSKALKCYCLIVVVEGIDWWNSVELWEESVETRTQSKLFSCRAFLHVLFINTSFSGCCGDLYS
jgi:hypothetical protein